jgi:hypothetical protein
MAPKKAKLHDISAVGKVTVSSKMGVFTYFRSKYVDTLSPQV